MKTENVNEVVRCLAKRDWRHICVLFGLFPKSVTWMGKGIRITKSVGGPFGRLPPSSATVTKEKQTSALSSALSAASKRNEHSRQSTPPFCVCGPSAQSCSPIWSDKSSMKRTQCFLSFRLQFVVDTTLEKRLKRQFEVNKKKQPRTVSPRLEYKKKVRN